MPFLLTFFETPTKSYHCSDGILHFVSQIKQALEKPKAGIVMMDSLGPVQSRTMLKGLQSTPLGTRTRLLGIGIVPVVERLCGIEGSRGN